MARYKRCCRQSWLQAKWYIQSSSAPTPPHRARRSHDSEVANRFPKNDMKKTLECLDANTNKENSPLYVRKTETPIWKEVAATTECVLMHPSVRCCPDEWPLSELWRGLHKPIFWRAAERRYPSATHTSRHVRQKSTTSPKRFLSDAYLNWIRLLVSRFLCSFYWSESLNLRHFSAH